VPALVLEERGFPGCLAIEGSVYLQRGGERVLRAPGSDGLARVADAEHCSLRVTELLELDVGQQRWGRQ